ncbi:MAG TPA: AmmeMemoRadiSam system protein B [Gemmatimonadales bacterium]|jgi:AmmeMemoRadiSam system protein B
MKTAARASMRREPAVAGAFYPDDPAEFRALVEQCLVGVPAEGRFCRGALVPHAGLVFSGRCAGEVLGRLGIPPVVVILAPNHTGRADSPGASLWREGEFLTPLGPVPIESEFAARLEAASDLVAHDPVAHEAEHAIEVELPFLRLLAPESAIVPLVLGFADAARCSRLAAQLASTVAGWDGPVLLLASSDMNHYESAATAARKDRIALQRIEHLDGPGLLEACRAEGITMCGRGPAAVMLQATQLLGAGQAELVSYRHSGEVSGDDTGVVSYAGVIIA